jgi:hypothetical protein
MGKKKKKKERITLWYASDLNLWKESDNQTGISFIKIILQGVSLFNDSYSKVCTVFFELHTEAHPGAPTTSTT